jgi:hypothetical protein
VQFEHIESALLTWAGTVTGLPAVIENRPRSHLLKVAGYVVVSPPTSIKQVGEDYINNEEIEDDPTMVRPTLVARREFSVPLRVICRSQSPSKTGRYWIEKLRESLKKPSVLEFFKTNEIGIVRMGPTANFDAPFDERIESVGAAELRLCCAVTDTDSDVGFIETVELSSHIEGVDGQELPAPPNLDEAIFPEE